MMKNTTETDVQGLTRRDLLGGAGKVAAGTLLVSAGGLYFNRKASAKGAREYKYVKLDPEEAGQIAYENWYKNFCSYAVASGIILPLQKRIGEPYTSFPLEVTRFAHGGVVGWGTLCGTLFGAGVASNLIAGRKGEDIINDVIAWYASTDLPMLKPKNPKLDSTPVISKSNSPLCHVSVGKWMSKADKKFFSPERKDRCARLAGDIAMQTVMLLNAWHDGSYVPKHGSQMKAHGMTAQNNCEECHGA
jgi:hypothetical protein